MLARLQQAIVLGLLGLCVAWVLAHAGSAPLRAAALPLMLVGGYLGVMAVEFMLMAVVSRGDSVPAARARALVRAWVGEVLTAPRVFGWWQPWWHDAVADQAGANARGRRGVVLVHGFVCNRGMWTPWLRVLRDRGDPFVAVNLEPVFGSIDDYVPLIDAAVRRLVDATGVAPLVVCHSMGGLAVRAWLAAQSPAAPAPVHRVVTIGTPHHGTWLSRLSFFTNGSQMRQDSRWLAQLRQAEAGRVRAPFTCWHSDCDNIVFPPSTASLAGADNRLIPGVAHVHLAFHPVLMQDTLALLNDV